MKQEDIDKRIRRSNEYQDPDGKCLICKRPFQLCNHLMVDVQFAIQMYRARNLTK